MALTWNIHGARDDTKLVKLREVADEWKISLICIQESQVNIPNKSIISLFPSEYWKIVWTKNTRIVEGQLKRLGGLVTLINTRRTKMSFKIEDTSSDLMLSHTIYFENQTKFINCYARPQHDIPICPNVLDSNAQFIMGDLNYYILDSLKNSDPIRYKQLFKLHDDEKYTFNVNFNSFGSCFNPESRSVKQGPDHFLSISHLAENFEVKTVPKLDNLSDHLAIFIHGSSGFNNCFQTNIESSTTNDRGFYFDYDCISDKFIYEFYENLIRCYDSEEDIQSTDDHQKSIGQSMDIDRNSPTSFTFEEPNSNTPEATSNFNFPIDSRNANRRTSTKPPTSTSNCPNNDSRNANRRTSTKPPTSTNGPNNDRRNAIRRTSTNPSTFSGSSNVTISTEALIADKNKHKEYLLNNLIVDLSELLTFCRKPRKLNERREEYYTIDQFQEKQADSVLADSGMSTGFSTLKKAVLIDNEFVKVSENKKVDFDFTKADQVTQFSGFKKRVGTNFQDKRSEVIADKRARIAVSKFSNSFDRISLSEIIRAAVKTKKASVGYDRIPFRFLPKTRRHWEFFLRITNRQIFGQDQFHHLLQSSRLVFIKKACGSLRPISISSRISALLENALLPKFQQLLLKSKNHSSHFGFLYNKNLEQLNSKLIDNIYRKKNKKLVSNLLMIDLQKAYDCLSIRKALNSIWSLVKNSGDFNKYGIVYQFSIKWAENRVSYYGREKAVFARGLPQGSPWSCLAFIAAMGIDHLDFGTDSVEVSVFQFADDITCLVSSKTRLILSKSIPLIIEKFHRYFGEFGLKLNHNKTEILELFKKSESKAVRVLGLYYDTNLTFMTNMRMIKKWLNPRLNYFVVMRGFLKDKYNFAVWRRFAHHLRSRICFGIWHLCLLSEEAFYKYEKCWLQSIRKIFGFNKLVPSKEIFNFSGFAPLSDYMKYILAYRTITYENFNFSSIFDSIQSIEYGANLAGRKALRKKWKIVDYFVKKDEKSSNVSRWREKIHLVLNGFESSKNLKYGLKKQILKVECVGNLKTFDASVIVNLNTKYFKLYSI